MDMNLMCGRCSKKWTVARWSPGAMCCPKCGSRQLGNARSVIEEKMRLDKRNAAEERKRIANEKQP